MTAQPADDWQQNAGVALIQLQRLERSEQPSPSLSPLYVFPLSPSSASLKK